MRSVMRSAVVAASGVALTLGGVAAVPAAAHAAGNGPMGVYQVGVSVNHDGPSGGGGFWGWLEFDSRRTTRTRGTAATAR